MVGRMQRDADHPMPILFADEAVVAVHKPAGWVAHRTQLCPDAPAVLSALQQRLGCSLATVHRLDRPTCGVLLLARSTEAASRLGAAFRDGLVRKDYLAVVRGWTEEAGCIDHPLPRDLDGPRREAVTTYRRVATCELPIPVAPYPNSRYSLLVLQPATGRRHQIRLHCKHIAHPIVGDVQYGRSEHNRMFRSSLAMPRLLLQALRVRLPHPLSGEPLTITTELDPQFLPLFRRFGWPTATAAIL